MTAQRGRLDPDVLAALEEEREFLLRSLNDLDAEHEAGDLDHGDYVELKDDYTRRAATVIRSVDEQQLRFQAVPRIRWQQVLVWLVGLALLGGLSGALIARSTGARTAGQSASGDVRRSVVSRLNMARAALGDPEQWDDALDLYDSVLEDQPSSVEALTYGSWLRYRQGESVDALLLGFEEVARLDPQYADSIVFHAIVLVDSARYDEAAEVMRRLDRDTAPEAVTVLLDQRGLVGKVFGEASYAQLSAEVGPTLDDLALSVDFALAAAGYLLSTDKPERTVAALKLYRGVRLVEPDNPAALSREAILLALTGDPVLLDQALVLVTRAVEANPNDAEAGLSMERILVLAAGDG